MDSKIRTKEKLLIGCIYVIFVVYIIFLLRITLFKQAPIYNLLAAIGASERSVSVIPFKSVFDMIIYNSSLIRILENVLGNIVLFIPLGLLFPIMTKKDNKSIILVGMLFSVVIEIIQFLLRLGSTDIDDVIFNTIGVIIGYLLFIQIKKKSKSTLSFLASMVAFVFILGSIAFSVLFVNNTDLFLVSPKEVTIENGELVQGFIETPNYLSGKLVEVKDSILSVEKTVQNASEQRQFMTFNITPESEIYICYNKMNYFFSTISGEHKCYEQIEYLDFISNESKAFDKGNNVIIWSQDGEFVEKLVVIVWVE